MKNYSITVRGRNYDLIKVRGYGKTIHPIFYDRISKKNIKMENYKGWKKETLAELDLPQHTLDKCRDWIKFYVDNKHKENK